MPGHVDFVVFPRVCSPVVFLVAALATACKGPVEPVFIKPALENLEIRQFAFFFQGEWAMEVRARLANADFSLSPHMRMRVRVETELGDVEEINLRPEVCETGDINPDYMCTSLLMGMEAGHHINELRPHLQEVPARLSWVMSDGSIGSMWMLLEGDVNAAVDKVQSWPGVAYAQRVSHSPQDPFEYGVLQFPKFVLVRALVDFGAPVPGDHVVQAKSGDMVSVEYVQPGGEVLAASFTMCEMEEGGGTPITGLGQEPPCG